MSDANRAYELADAVRDLLRRLDVADRRGDSVPAPYSSILIPIAEARALAVEGERLVDLIAPREVGNVETVETEPGVFCETCDRNITGEERAPHDGHAIIDYLYGEDDDPISRILSKHWASPIPFDDATVMCRCTERFDGPVYHRRHIAEQIRKLLRGETVDEEPWAHTIDEEA